MEKVVEGTTITLRSLVASSIHPCVEHPFPTALPTLSRQSFLELPPAKMDEVVRGLDISVDQLSRMLEELSRLH
jgi:hypothetical protein